MSLLNTKVSPKMLTILFGALGIILMFFLLVNQIGALNKAQEQLALEEQALHTANIRLEQLLELKERGPEFENYLTTLEQLIPAEPQEDVVLSSLEKISQNTETTLTQVRFENRQATDDYVEIPLNLSFSGNYNSFVAMLTELQSLQRDGRAFRLENITISAERLDLSVKTFYRD